MRHSGWSFAIMLAAHLCAAAYCQAQPGREISALLEATPAARSAFWGIEAVDLDTGKIAWKAKTPQPLIGGVLATAGNLVFNGEANGWFKAYDASNGNILWKFQTGAGVNAPPSSYTVNGKQYVVVGAGGNVQIDSKRGNSIIAFAMP